MTQFLRTAQMRRRVLMTLFGVCGCAIAVGMLTHATLGLDPFSVLMRGIWRHTRLSYGTYYTLVNALMLAGVFLVDRKKIGLGTLINLFLLGYIVDFSTWACALLFPDPSLPVRVALLLLGLLLVCITSALYYTGDLGVSTYDAIALTLGERTRVPFQVWRVTTDVSCVLLGGALCYLSDHSLAPGGALLVTVGVGTLVVAFFMGPFVAFFNRTLAIPLRYGKRPEKA